MSKENTPLLDCFCYYCNLPVKKPNRKYCSNKCWGFAQRGRARGNPYSQAKNHTRISLGKDLLGNTIRVYLHRHIVAIQVRPLREGEVVHHKDENKFNNSLSNLEILASQSEYRSLHNQLAQDKQVIQDFEFEKDPETGQTYYF